MYRTKTLFLCPASTFFLEKNIRVLLEDITQHNNQPILFSLFEEEEAWLKAEEDALLAAEEALQATDELAPAENEGFPYFVGGVQAEEAWLAAEKVALDAAAEANFQEAEEAGLEFQERLLSERLGREKQDKDRQVNESANGAGKGFGKPKSAGKRKK